MVSRYSSGTKTGLVPVVLGWFSHHKFSFYILRRPFYDSIATRHVHRFDIWRTIVKYHATVQLYVRYMPPPPPHIAAF